MIDQRTPRTRCGAFEHEDTDMKQPFNLSFKKQPTPTGLWAVGNPDPVTEIKVNKKIVGHIVPPSWNSAHKDWIVRLAVKQEPTPADPAPFKWKTLSKHFDDEPAARLFLIANVEGLKLWNFHSFDE